MTNKRLDTPDDELSRDDEDFARRTGTRLRESASELDAATLSRLNRARQKALDEMTGKKRVAYGWLVPAGVTALGATVVIGLWQAGGSGDTPVDFAPLTAEDVTDFELLLDEGELEMIEDLEFFAWLAVEDLEAAG